MQKISKPQTDKPTVIVKCKSCGKSMTRGRFGTREFCSNACRQAHYRRRKSTA